MFICIMPYSTKQIICFIFSDSQEEGGTSAECLLCAKYGTRCLFTFVSRQLHHSLQIGIVFLIYFTFEETEVTLLGCGRASI